MVPAAIPAHRQRRFWCRSKNPGPAAQPRKSRMRLPGSGAINHYLTLPGPLRIGSQAKDDREQAVGGGRALELVPQQQQAPQSALTGFGRELREWTWNTVAAAQPPHIAPTTPIMQVTMRPAISCRG